VTNLCDRFLVPIVIAIRYEVGQYCINRIFLSAPFIRLHLIMHQTIGLHRTLNH